MSLEPAGDARSASGWRSLVLGYLTNEGRLSEQSARRIGLVLERFERFLISGYGIASLRDVRPDHVERFVRAWARNGDTPSVATMHLRRSAVRLAFRSARELAIAGEDPTLDVALPARSGQRARPLTDEEIPLCRSASLASLTETRLPAIWALAEATARTSELPTVRIRDVSFEHGRVFLHGGSKVEPRWSVLTEWGSLQLDRRVQALPTPKDPDALMAYAGDGSPESRQASAATAIRTILVRAGLGAEPDLRPASVAAWTGARLLADGHPIEEVARRLGMRSLDACVRLIGHDWKAGR